MNPKTMSFVVNAGSKLASRNDVKLEAGALAIPPDPSIVTYSIFKPALLSLLSYWSCDWANAYAFKMGYWKAATAPGVPPMPYSRFHMPWLSYLSAPLAEGIVLPHDIVSERTADGGLLMIAAQERLDPANPEHMKRSRVLSDIMVERIGGDQRSPHE